ncbi:hypothetical protein [[Kitasatospora] papulosa]|uniref:hypothetical protein n=1 Tax=[Kitasatospora] papulosa TaxID=1464011 RepID=UPI0036455018
MSPTPTNPTRTTWPSAAPLQQAADIRRAAGDPELADWLDATANALAWLAPYRDSEPGYGMWEAALVVARRVLGTPATPAASGERPDHELYTALRKYGHTPETAQQMIDNYTQKILTRQGTPTVNRAAVLREAADVIERMQHDRDDVVNDALGGLDRITEAQHTAVHRAAAGLRRLAAEAQQPAPAETEEHRHRWVIARDEMSEPAYRNGSTYDICGICGADPGATKAQQ